MCKEGVLADGLTFATLLGKAIAMFLLVIYYYELHEPLARTKDL